MLDQVSLKANIPEIHGGVAFQNYWGTPNFPIFH